MALAIGIVAGGCGGALGYMLGGQAMSSEDKTAGQAQDPSRVSPTGDASIPRSDASPSLEEKDHSISRTHGSVNADDKTTDKSSHATTPVKMTSSKLTVRELSPIVTNLAEPANNWIRLQSAIVFNPEELPHPEKTIAELTSDITGYLRTIPLSSLEGADGLRRLQEELSDRAAIRSNGKIHEFIVETMVVQ